MTNRMIGHFIGGFAVGFVEKTFPNIPTIPLIGRKGTIAIGAAVAHKWFKSPLVADIAVAGASISGYELGATGAISGDVLGDDGDTLASQM